MAKVRPRYADVVLKHGHVVSLVVSCCLVDNISVLTPVIQMNVNPVPRKVTNLVIVVKQLQYDPVLVHSGNVMSHVENS